MSDEKTTTDPGGMLPMEAFKCKQMLKLDVAAAVVLAIFTTRANLSYGRTYQSAILNNNNPYMMAMVYSLVYILGARLAVDGGLHLMKRDDPITADKEMIMSACLAFGFDTMYLGTPPEKAMERLVLAAVIIGGVSRYTGLACACPDPYF